MPYSFWSYQIGLTYLQIILANISSVGADVKASGFDEYFVPVTNTTQDFQWMNKMKHYKVGSN